MAEEEVHEAFERWDEDGDGTISLKEFVGIMTSLGLDKEAANTLFAAVDVDESGSLDISELVSWFFSNDGNALGMASVAADSKGWAFVPVEKSQPEYESIAQLFIVPDPHNLGYGRDVRSSDGKYNKLVVEGVWKILNPDQTTLYKSAKKVMRRTMNRLKSVENLVETPSPTKFDEIGIKCNKKTNEKVLLHGTKPDVVLTIVQNGLDEKFSGGLFGCGVYLAEDPSKIDQYCTPDPPPEVTDEVQALHDALYDGGDPPCKVFYAFVAKALLGTPVHTTDGETATKPSEGESIWIAEDKRQLSVVPDTSPPVHFHSLIADLGEVVRRHREFVVFDGDNIILEYLVAYRREWDDEIKVKIPGKKIFGTGYAKEVGGTEEEPEGEEEEPQLDPEELEKCDQCDGGGYVHSSSMPHTVLDMHLDSNLPMGGKCFFCQDCKKCDGTGYAIPDEPMAEGEVDCYKCTGKGFWHSNPSMPHDSGDDRCFFCEDCNACGGTGRISHVKRCNKCRGRAFFHYSNMSHSPNPNQPTQRCFFCEDCKSCGGMGYIGDSN